MSLWEKIQSFLVAGPWASTGIVPPSLDTAECRAAVHEAGHALLALRCSIVSNIVEVSIDAEAGTGRVEYDIDVRSKNYESCSIVIHLGGLAAEGLVFGKFRTGHARTDLLKARRLAQSLSERNESFSLSSPSVRSTHVFDQSLPNAKPEETKILESARLYAKSVLKRGIQQHTQIVSLLLSRNGFLREDDLRQTFGTRRALFALGMVRGGFFV